MAGAGNQSEHNRASCAAKKQCKSNHQQGRPIVTCAGDYKGQGGPLDCLDLTSATFEDTASLWGPKQSVA